MRALALTISLIACGNNGESRRDAGSSDGVVDPDGMIDLDGMIDPDGMVDPDGMIDPDGTIAPDGMIASDAMGDAPANVRGTVTVQVVDRNGDGLAGMHAVFIDTDTTVTDTLTDVNGIATASVYSGASVTVVRERTGGMAFQLTTLLALAPGETVTIVGSPGSVSSTDDPFTSGLVPLPARYITDAKKQGSTGTYTTLTPHGLAVGDTVVVEDVVPAGYNGTFTVATVPTTTSFTASIGSGGLVDTTGGTAAKADRFTVTYGAYAGAASYEIYSPCGRTETLSTTQVILLRTGCSAASMNLVVVAKNAGGTVLAWRDQAAITFTPNGNVTLGGAWSSPSSITASYSNTTASVTNVSLRRLVPYNREPGVANTGTVSGGAASVMVMGSLPAQAAMVSRFTCVGAGCVSTMAQQTVTQIGAGTGTTHALDVGANLLPWVEATWLPPSRTMDVSLTGTATYDLFQAAMTYTRVSTQVIYTWRVFGPTAQSLQFPTLPSTVPGDPTVRTNDAQASYFVGLCESDAIAGYREAIENVYLAYGTCLASSAADVVRLGGTLNRISASK